MYLQVSPLAAFYFFAAIPMYAAYPSAFASVLLWGAAMVQQYSFYREESGDGGRAQRRKAAEVTAAAAAKRKAATPNETPASYLDGYVHAGV